MALKASKNKDIRLGLDIGTRLVKGVEVSFEGAKQTLTKLHSVEIEFPPSEEKTSAALKTLLDALQSSVRDVNISLSAPSAIVRFISLPKMTEEDMKSSLRFEADKYIPFNIKEVAIDAAILGFTNDEKKQMQVLFAAAKKKAVESRVSMLKGLGLSVSIIDIDGFACFNAFLNSSDNPDPAKSAALLNVGYTQTNLVIMQGDKPFFTRDIQIAGRDVAQAITGRLGVTEAESDKFIFDPKDKALQVSDAARPVLHNLIDEIRLSFGYYENQHGRGIEAIYLSGGLAGLGGIFKLFEENFEIKTMPWNPFAKFEIGPELKPESLESKRAQFAVSCGLAIRRAKL
ncbi:MAG: type IV pilus assembly protein PilM [Omnitrophica bacterium]|nr:type IV pilus assembly protein PilM [Candidatus Omnitrophota bacterium]